MTAASANSQLAEWLWPLISSWRRVLARTLGPPLASPDVGTQGFSRRRAPLAGRLRSTAVVGSRSCHHFALQTSTRVPRLPLRRQSLLVIVADLDLKRGTTAGSSHLLADVLEL